MPVYITFFKWTEQGRQDLATLPARVGALTEHLEQLGGKVRDVYLMMGPYNLIAITEAPSDHVIAKMAFVIAGRGNAVTETWRAFSVEELRNLL